MERILLCIFMVVSQPILVGPPPPQPTGGTCWCGLRKIMRTALKDVFGRPEQNAQSGRQKPDPTTCVCVSGIRKAAGKVGAVVCEVTVRKLTGEVRQLMQEVMQGIQQSIQSDLAKINTSLPTPALPTSQTLLDAIKKAMPKAALEKAIESRILQYVSVSDTEFDQLLTTIRQALDRLCHPSPRVESNSQSQTAQSWVQWLRELDHLAMCRAGGTPTIEEIEIDTETMGDPVEQIHAGSFQPL